MYRMQAYKKAKYILYIVHFIMLLCHGIKLEGGENVEYSFTINCDKGLEVRGEVNAPFINVNSIL